MEEITTVYEIKRASEKYNGKTVHKSTIHPLLSRNRLQKVVPRPAHVNADKEKQEEFKKTFLNEVENIIAERDSEDNLPILIVVQYKGRFGRISNSPSFQRF